MTAKTNDPKQTKVHLMQVAASEFATVGFQNTSLRNICKKAGCTTGAIYFFFENKDDLFKQVIESVTFPMYDFMKEHFTKELTLDIGELLSHLSPFQDPLAADWADEDKNELTGFLHFYYSHKNAFDVLLNNRHHPVVEAFFNDVIQLFQDHYMAIIKQVAEIRHRTTPIDEYAVHWFSKTDLEMILNLISNDFSEEEAIKHGGNLLKVMQAGFMTLL